jgi:NDP-sugar pyrophosphorylase family protein
MHKNLQAVILAGGKGTRLLSLTKEMPKAMIDVNGKPFIEVLINQLKKKV